MTHACAYPPLTIASYKQGVHINYYVTIYSDDSCVCLPQNNVI